MERPAVVFVKRPTGQLGPVVEVRAFKLREEATFVVREGSVFICQG